MRKGLEGLRKYTECIRGNMALVKEHLTQGNTLANPDISISGEFCIFDISFNFNVAITLPTVKMNK